PPGEVACGNVCTDTSQDPTNCGACGSLCGSGVVCQTGVCQPCAPGLTACSKTCVDLTSDLDHCGECFNKCAPGDTCFEILVNSGCMGWGLPVAACQPPGTFPCLWSHLAPASCDDVSFCKTGQELCLYANEDLQHMDGHCVPLPPCCSSCPC